MAGTLSRRFRLTRGRTAEQDAERFLRARGLTLLERNYRCRVGELDLVMLDGDCLVVVEVRYRHSNRFVDAALTVDAPKQARIVRATRCLLSGRPSLADHAVRFDVVALGHTHGQQGAIQWIRDAFRVP